MLAVAIFRRYKSRVIGIQTEKSRNFWKNCEMLVMVVASKNSFDKKFMRRQSMKKGLNGIRERIDRTSQILVKLTFELVVDLKKPRDCQKRDDLVTLELRKIHR